MSLWSALSTSRQREHDSTLVGDNVIVSKDQKDTREEVLFQKKLKSVLGKLEAYDAGKDMSDKSVTAMIHAIREFMPHLHHKERRYLKKMYNRIKRDERKRK